MRKLKIGYIPISKIVSAAGDRRRLEFWANSRGHEVVNVIDESADVIVATVNADLNLNRYVKYKKPVIFDLVDAYFLPSNFMNDFTRGILKNINGQISGKLKPFSKSVWEFAERADAVICSSPEQMEVISEVNSNTHVILDSHEEFPILVPRTNDSKKFSTVNLLWEGQPATIKGFKAISKVLEKLSEDIKLKIDLVTDEKYFRLLNKYFVSETISLVENDLRKCSSEVSIIPWSVQNITITAEKSDFGVLPLDLSQPIQKLKPENRLLIMWRLGLPVITSETQAYARVAREVGVKVCCRNEIEWEATLREFINNPGVAEEQVRLGQKYIKEVHSKEKLLEKWDQAVRSVVPNYEF